MREGRSEVCVLVNAMYCFRNVGKDPGRLASSMVSCSVSSLERVLACFVIGLIVSSSCSRLAAEEEVVRLAGVGADGAEGCEMAF